MGRTTEREQHIKENGQKEIDRLNAKHMQEILPIEYQAFLFHIANSGEDEHDTDETRCLQEDSGDDKIIMMTDEDP